LIINDTSNKITIYDSIHIFKCFGYILKNLYCPKIYEDNDFQILENIMVNFLFSSDCLKLAMKLDKVPKSIILQIMNERKDFKHFELRQLLYESMFDHIIHSSNSVQQKLINIRGQTENIDEYLKTLTFGIFKSMYSKDFKYFSQDKSKFIIPYNLLRVLIDENSGKYYENIVCEILGLTMFSILLKGKDGEIGKIFLNYVFNTDMCYRKNFDNFMSCYDINPYAYFIKYYKYNYDYNIF
jgi:hypothetical protein